MIGYIKGKIISVSENIAIVDVSGIGYCVHLNENSIQGLKKGDSKDFFIHTAVRENDISLYGFIKSNELELFKLLISVKGIGPKSGLEMLNCSVEEIKSAIAMKDDALLARTPGIGKKTAQRIIVELQSKIEDFDLNESRTHAGLGKEIEDAVGALEGLGYKKNFISSHLQEIPKDVKNAEEIIRYFLSRVNK